MILYHFTAQIHLPKILTAGYLDTTESNMSRRRTHAAPDVVWLTSNGDPTAHGHGLATSAVDKMRIRFTVDISKRDAHRWRQWAASRGIDQAWMRNLALGGGSATWWVVERRIASSEWVEVIDTVSGLDPRGLVNPS